MIIDMNYWGRVLKNIIILAIMGLLGMVVSIKIFKKDNK